MRFSCNALISSGSSTMRPRRGVDEKGLGLHQAELAFADKLMRARIIIAGNANVSRCA